MRGINFREDFSWSSVPRMGGGGGGTTNTVQKSDPWGGQQPQLLDIYSQAQNLDHTTSPNYYPGNTYASITPTQRGVMGQLIGQGADGGNTGLTAANTNVTNTLSPYYTAGTANQFGQGQSVLSSEMDPGYLNPWNSPSFQTVVNNTLASAVPAATNSFVNGNRSDSGLATRAATMAATDAVGNLAQQQYNTNQQIQQGAVAQAGNNFLTQQGNQMKAAALAPGIDQAQMGDLGSALSAAGMGQSDLQNQITADMSRYNYGQMLPWNQLNLYQQAIQGGGSPGSSSTTQQPYFDNTTANVIGGAGALGSLGLMAMMAFSDRRLKDDIHKIGESDSGFPLYMFRYKGEAPGTMHIGVMAQDIEKERPDAVLHTPHGMMVNYIKALAV